mgnify:CR=1 FL=1|jgi:Aspartate/tyrosine/aromatic aminotransferase
MNLSDRNQLMGFSPIRKFNKYASAAEKAGKKIYHLNIGQPDIKTPSSYFDAIKSFNQEVLAYASSEGNPDLREAISNYFKRVDVDFTPDDILITNGGSEALMLLFLALLNDGDEVIMAEPYYTNYLTFIQAAGGSIRPITTTAEDGYHYADRDKIEACITDKTKVIALVSPGNPTGSVLTKDEIKMICDIAVEHDLIIMADEVYREFVYDGKEMTSFGQVKEAANNVVVIDSVSKRFSACGARIGCICTKNAELMSGLMKFAQGRLCCPTIDQVGSTALYNLDPSYFGPIKAEYDHRRNVAYEELQKIDGIVCAKPSGAFYISCKLPVDNAEDLLMFLLTEWDDNGETVMFAPEEGFYVTPGLGKSECRLAYVLCEDDLRKGIQLLNKGIQAYMNK